MKGWHDAAYSRVRLLRAIKMFDEGKARHHEAKGKSRN